MNREDYISKKEEELKNIIESDTLKNYQFQTFAKKLKGKFSKKFDESFLWRKSLYLSSKGAYLLQINPNNEIGINALKTAAEIYENLYYISELYDKNYCLLLSALCYDISGYQANALTLINYLSKNKEYYKVQGSFEDAELIYNENIILLTLQLFLQKKIALLNEEKDLIKELNEIIPYYNNTLKYYKESLYLLCSGILSGEDNEYLESMQKSHLSSINSNNTMISHLFDLFYVRLCLFNQRNVWSVLKKYKIDISNEIWNKYLRLLTRNIYENSMVVPKENRTSIFEFWKSQLNAFEAGVLNPQDSFTLQMPTSAGKTFISELIILNSLIEKKGSKCLYIAPFRALTTEIISNFSNRLENLGFSTSTILGGYEQIEDYQLEFLENTDILIATPEKIDMLHRIKPEFFNDVSIVVIDEGHVIGSDDDRSATLELLILKLKNKNPDAKFLFISAVMSKKDSENLSLFFSETRKNSISSPTVYGKEWQPTRKLIGFFQWYKQSDFGNITFPHEKINSNPLFIPNIIESKNYGKIKKSKKGSKELKFPRKSSKAETAATLAYKFSENGTVLVFASQKRNVEAVGKRILDLLKINQHQNKNDSRFEKRDSKSVKMAEKWFGKENIITKCLKRGIGFHYGSLHENIRKSIEEDFREKKLNILISTNTIGQGLNFPIKTVIIHSLIIGYKEDKKVLLSVRDFWNIVGRAGRAGKETEGQIIFLNFNKTDEQYFWRYTNKSYIEPVETKLFLLIKDLVKNRLSTNDFLKSFKGLIEPSILNILMEESPETVDEVLIKKYFKKSLFNIQLENENINKFNKISSFIIDIGNNFYSKVENSKLRKIYSTTGLSLNSCMKISKSIQSDYEFYFNILNEDDYEKLINKIFFVLIDLDEMQDEKLEKSFIDNGKDDLISFICSWISGSNSNELTKLWISFSDEEQKPLDLFVDWNNNSDKKDINLVSSLYTKEIDKMHIFINQMLQFRYPWGITAFLNILEHHINEKQHPFKLAGKIKHISSFMKYGVNDTISCFSKDLGIETRECCIFLSNIYKNEFNNYTNNFEEFKSWFSEIEIETIENFELPDYDKLNISNVSNRLSFKSFDIKNIEIMELELDINPVYFKKNNELKIDTKLILKRNTDNEYNIYDVNLLYNNEIVGKIPKRYSKFIALEMDINDKKYYANITYFSINYTTIQIHEMKK